MTPERWRVVKSIFAGAIELPTAHRWEFIDRECAGDEEVRREVESLLIAHAREGESRPKPIGHIREPVILQDPVPSEPTIRAILSRAIGSQYEIVRPIGIGGMGAVYLARDKALDIQVAIKALRPEHAGSVEIRERFRREARMAAAFKHPSIVPLHWYGEVEQLCFFVMRYMSGGTLAHRLEVDGPIGWEVVRDILVQLADALAYAHEHDVIHRDIKPANILFEEDGRPMLADFGIAKLAGADTLTGSNQRPGTPHYMSPEQLRGIGEVDARTDLYSLGLVAYAMIIGTEEIPGRLRGSKGAPHTTPDPLPLKAAAPPELAAVILRCLEPDPRLRYADARALKEALACVGGDNDPPLSDEENVGVGFGHYSLVWAILWTTYAFVGEHGSREVALTLIVAFLVPLGFALHLWNLRSTRLGFRDLICISY